MCIPTQPNGWIVVLHDEDYTYVGQGVYYWMDIFGFCKCDCKWMSRVDFVIFVLIHTW